MFKLSRKYSTFIMFILMGLTFACFVADAYADTQQFALQNTVAANMTVVVDDFDLDEDDDDEVVAKFFGENKGWASLPTLESSGRKTARSKCPMDLLRGQVRRYSPRNSLSDGHNYVLLKNTKSGVGLFRTTFFVPFFNQKHYECNRYFYSNPNLDGGHRRVPHGLPDDEFAS